jgi:hypothetical protein
LTSAVEDACSAGDDSERDALCWEPPTEGDAAACGHAGLAGRGGDPGYVDAEGEGLTTEIAETGDDGEPGSMSTFDNCDHTVDHTHLGGS